MGIINLFGSIIHHDNEVDKIYFAEGFFPPLGVLAVQIEPHFCQDLADQGVDVRGPRRRHPPGHQPGRGNRLG